MRLFISFKTTPYEDELFSVENKLKSEINSMKMISDYRGMNDVKWVEADNLHLTIKFLGEVEEKLFENIVRTIGSTIQSFNSFNFSIRGISGFPDPKNARVLFFSISDGSDCIAQIMRSVDSSLANIGFDLEKSYVPHITFARAKSKSINLENAKWDKFFISVEAKGVLIMRSVLTKEGPIYSILKEFDFFDK